jgi:hypothetical protein
MEKTSKGTAKTRNLRETTGTGRGKQALEGRKQALEGRKQAMEGRIILRDSGRRTKGEG